MDKNESKNLNKVRHLLIMLNNLLQMQLKLLKIEQFKKQQKQLVIKLEIKLLIKLQECHKLHH